MRNVELDSISGFIGKRKVQVKHSLKGKVRIKLAL